MAVMEAHSVLGHIAPEAVKKLIRDGLVTGIDVDINTEITPCDICTKGKATRKPIAKAHVDPRSSRPGELIHTDLWGAARVEAKGGKKYYVSFTDDYTRMTHLALMRTKDEALSKYKVFEAMMKNQYSIDLIAALHGDRGGEFRARQPRTERLVRTVKPNDSAARQVHVD